MSIEQKIFQKSNVAKMLAYGIAALISAVFICGLVQALILSSNSSRNEKSIMAPILFERIDSAFKASGDRINYYRCEPITMDAERNYEISCSNWVDNIANDFSILGNLSGKSGYFQLRHSDSAIIGFVREK